MTLSRLPVVRAARRLGAGRLASLAFGLAVIWSFAGTIVLWRPDLLRPTDIGSDTSNYFAAAQRVIDGHPLYELTAGDRPAPADNPPDWTVPILSPPSLPALFLPLVMLPGPTGMVLWWAACFAAAAAFAAFLAMRAPPWVLWVGVPLTILSAITAWSGNVNALLPGMAALMWLWAGEEGARPRTLILAGVLGAVGAGIKLGPVAFLPWLMGRGRVGASIAFLGAIASLFLVVVLMTGGLGSVQEYLGVSAHATEQATPLSPVGIARSLGLPAGVAASTPFLMIAGSAAFSLLSRRTPQATFAVAAAVSVLASPALRVESLAQLLMCAVPWAVGSGNWRLPPVRGSVAAVAALCFVAAIVGSVVGGGIRQSSVSIENRSSAVRVIRFQVTAQAATFGFVLRPGEAGVAWSDVWGGVVQPVLVFDGSCRLVGTTLLPRDGGEIVLSGGGIAQAQARMGPPLSFNPMCARAVPPIGPFGDTKDWTRGTTGWLPSRPPAISMAGPGPAKEPQ